MINGAEQTNEHIIFCCNVGRCYREHGTERAAQITSVIF